MLGRSYVNILQDFPEEECIDSNKSNPSQWSLSVWPTRSVCVWGGEQIISDITVKTVRFISSQRARCERSPQLFTQLSSDLVSSLVPLVSSCGKETLRWPDNKNRLCPTWFRSAGGLEATYEAIGSKVESQAYRKSNITNTQILK